MWDVTTILGIFKPIRKISTHTSRVGCDYCRNYRNYPRSIISTHTSRVGCDLYRSRRSYHFLISTHTSRVGCDQEELQQKDRDLHFYSHIPCGMWPIQSNDGLIIKKFLLTHPVWDVTGFISAYTPSCLFLLTHPVWDVTHILTISAWGLQISTHTSRVGCDNTL